MEIKYCYKCKETKPVSEFNKHCTSKDGLHSNCKSCVKEYYEKNKDSISIKRKEYREKNKDSISIWQKEWREKNKDSISIRQKEYRENNKDSISIRQKEYRENNKDSISIWQKEWRENNKDSILEYREKNKDSISIRQKEYQKNNRDSILIKKKEYQKNNRDSILIKNKEYQKNNRDSISIKKKEHYEKNKDSILIKNYEYKKHRMSIDPIFKFKQNMSSSIGKAFRNKNYTKSSKTCEILGCDWNTLKEYFESQFDENMSWENHGTYWDIDHIIPLATAKTEEDVIKLNHYTNLQPLESYYNRYIKRHLILD